MAHTGWQISTLQDLQIIQLEIYGLFSEQTIISAWSETLALARVQNIDKVLIDKRKTAAPHPGHTDDPLRRLAYQLFSGHSGRTALLLADRQRCDESVMVLMQNLAHTDRIHCFYDREHALHWLAG